MIYDHNNEPVLEIGDLLELEDLLEDYIAPPPNPLWSRVVVAIGNGQAI